jgi:hypothetical protein
VTSQTGYLRSSAARSRTRIVELKCWYQTCVLGTFRTVYYSGPVSSAAAGEPFHVRLSHSRARADAMQDDDRRRSDLPGLVYIQGIVEFGGTHLLCPAGSHARDYRPVP